ncbi:MAG: sulfurtransferase TusA family protein [Proteobacteria bacterium]|nr:sulfurtransferase TusA family protein [Pseudomonadota bacterium]
MEKKILDVRGLSCPQPVYETKKAIEHPSFDVLEVLVDTKTALENIKRLLDSRKDIQYTVEEREDYKVTLSKLKG